VSAGASGERAVERGANETRVAAFTVILAMVFNVGLVVGFAASPLLGLLAGVAALVGTALLLAAIHRARAVRHVVMDLMHRITGQ
jgi:hypothetical protein